MAMPEMKYYCVNVSDDLLSLYDVTATYRDNGVMKTGIAVRETRWLRSILQDGYSAEIEVVMKARKEALSGELLVGDEFDMGISCEILSSGEYEDKYGKAPFTTKTLSGDGNSATFSFRVPVGNGNGDSVRARIAPLKFNKHFVFSYTVDDSYENGWSRIYSVINGQWVDDVEFFHKDAKPTTGSRNEPLCVSDGCGTDRRFSFGEAIWPNSKNSFSPDGLIPDVTVSSFFPYVSWEELQVMVDMGNAVYWHDIDTTRHSDKTVDGIVDGFRDDYDRTLSKIGYPMQTLAQPNGDALYLEAAAKSPLVRMTRATIGVDDVYPQEMQSLYKLNVFGGVSPGTPGEKLNELELESFSDRPRLISMLTHRPTMEEVDMFREIFRLYGRDGKDNIWVTSYDELYDYVEMRSLAQISESVTGGYKYFEVTVPDASGFLYKELSFVIEGADSPAEYVSDNLYGFTSAVQNDGSVLVNCCFDEKIRSRAEKYISRYEKAFNAEDRENAEYLISLLRADIAAPLIERLEGLREPTREEMPVSGKYTRDQMKFYLKLYPDYSISETRKW